jgi:hypothetical protein
MLSAICNHGKQERPHIINLLHNISDRDHKWWIFYPKKWIVPTAGYSSSTSIFRNRTLLIDISMGNLQLLQHHQVDVESSFNLSSLIKALNM